MTARPIVVDLDGTLIRTDLLFESANRYLRSDVLAVPRMLGWSLRGKSVLKAEIADRIDLDVTTLPYRDDVVSWLVDQRTAGHLLVLATASNQKYADAVAAHLGIFDAALGSDAETNLGSENKARVLVERYGDRGFDYVADRRADVPVWQHADVAHVVGAPARVVGAASGVATLGRSFPAGPSAAGGIFKAMRPHQWAKNALVLIPLVLSHKLTEPTAVISALIAFVAFSLAASSVYILNDLADLDADRMHRSKRRRPFASGRVSLLAGWAVWPLLIAASLAMSIVALPPGFVAALVGYIVLTFLYSFFLKSRAIIDVIVLALLYTSRLVAGALAIGAVTTFWLLAFSLFFFLSLALMKRYNDVLAARDDGNEGAISGRGYVHSDAEPVTSIGIAAGMVSVLILALYIKDPEVAGAYATPYALWPLVPLLLFWIARVWLLVHRGLVHDDPVFFALRDRMSWAVAAAGIVVFAAATWIQL